VPSDEERVHRACQHIRRIKASDYPTIVGRDDQYRIEGRPWAELPESSKLAILQDAVDWSGVTNRDRAHILLAEIDPGRITDAQRLRLIEMAVEKDESQELSRERAGGIGQPRGNGLGR
jgi:hypothetical protein